MKKFLKFLGITAVAAAVVPCKVEKDELTGVKTYQSLLSKLRVGPGKDGTGTDVRLDLLGGVVPHALNKPNADNLEEDDFDDLDGLVTEPIFEMKVERHVPPEEIPAEEEAEPEEETKEVAEPEAEEAAPEEPEVETSEADEEDFEDEKLDL